MGLTVFDTIPLWALFVMIVLTMVLANEIGYRLGQLRGRELHREGESPVSGMVAAELGLFAFLLAFTFGVTASRFENRRQIVVDEANAIGTTYLRAAMLPASQGTDARRLLREYVGVRVAATRDGSVEAAIRRSAELHERLWTDAVAAAREDPRSLPIGLFIQALNDVIDLHTKRIAAGLRSRIPPPVWVVLFGVAGLSFLAIGYHEGFVRKSRSPGTVVLALTFAAVLWLVVDLDRPGEGWLRVNQQAMIDLQSAMEADAGNDR